MFKSILKKIRPNNREEDEKYKIINGTIVGNEKKENINNNRVIKQKENKTYKIKEDIENENNAAIQERSKGRTKDIEKFFLTLKSIGRSKNTIKGYKYDLNYWQGIARKHKKTIYNLKLDEIEEANGGEDINTVKRRVSALRQLAKWYLRDGFPLLHIELEKIMIGRGKIRLPKAKSEEEFNRIKEEADKLIEEGNREGIWIKLMLLCGLRISEIQSVKVGKGSISVIGKGNKERKIPCSDELLKELKEFRAEGRGGYKKNKQIVDRYLRKLGYTNLHSLRHTYATILHQRGVPIEKVSKLLGHVDISTTQIYAQTKVDRSILEKLE